MMMRKLFALLLACTIAHSAFGEDVGVAPDKQAAGSKPLVVETPKAKPPKVVEAPAASAPKAAPDARTATPSASTKRDLPAPDAVSAKVHDAPPSAATAKPKIEVPARKVERLPLPGVGVLPGAKTTSPQDVVRAVEGKNQVVAVSNAFANRIATPFRAPKAVGIISETHVTIQQVGESLFVQFKHDEPLALYVTGTDPGDPVISLTLVPQPIPAQTVLVQINEAAHSAPIAAAAEASNRKEAASYTDKLVNTLRSAALSKSPAGFVEAPLPKATGRIGALIVTPEVRYSNAHMDVYRYKIETTGNDSVELDEASFDAEGVRAVAFFPSGKIRRGESVVVFVVSDKTIGGTNE